MPLQRTIPILINRFPFFIDEIKETFPATPVHTEKWQGVDISKKPEMAMHEILNVSFDMSLNQVEDLEPYQKHILPNLPWADDHFLERVSGHPLNPGTTWKYWPYNKSADTFRDSHGQFNHSYMERFWPKQAGKWVDGVIPDDRNQPSHKGIRHEYGDLGNLVSLLAAEPDTRQAYLPIFFPEDTGNTHSGRKPCTLGYHFIMRDNLLHCVYYIRSCDFIRHFRDDVYLAIRLLLWVLDRCRAINSNWESVKPGTFTMHITSLHMFRNDYLLMKHNGGNA